MTDDSSNEQGKRRRRKGLGLTLRDVARLAGVAPITASRALNTPDAVSDEILQRVKDAVERTGYVPNLLAGGLASRRSRLVAAVVPTISGSVFLETVQALTETLAASGYQMMLGQSGYHGSREDALLETIIGRRPDGVILTGIMHSTLARRRLVASGIPVVETWDLTPTPVDMLVGFSHEKVGTEVAQYLYGRGRRHMAAISADDERAIRRNRAFANAAQALGAATLSNAVPTHVVPAPSSVASGREGLRVLRAKDPLIDAIFCSSDMVALGVLTEAQAQGIKVPEQLAIIGLGDLAMSRELHPALTTVRVDGTLIGRTAARYIMQRAEGGTVAEPVCDVGFTIVERATT
ncbi:LacI family transcriptional regulator [Pseudoduganella flava]|uniref:LacI family DNA-binding transcriptional regulator n=1 Tax=Pseudoduganella flava TaxID=871742 RepID=A0A562PWP3_9BURK|nr:LacI family DNA-binding transcriptional regulator [Pseudoduganella flava]QGZ39936.1 LacI family DNA-binding transcriptional regulator [Pseudoduganella flava]TWI48871.1 LacI family transcriptional regulator [Pseudoduganella flava]